MDNDDIDVDTQFWFSVFENHSTSIVNKSDSKLIQDGLNKVFLIQTENENKKVILRVTRKKRFIPLTKDDYFFETSLLNHLSSRGFPVIQSLVWSNGENLLEITRNGEIYFLFLFEFAEGEPITPFDTQTQFKIGEFMANLHVENQNFNKTSKYNRIQWNIDKTVIKGCKAFTEEFKYQYQVLISELNLFVSWLLNKLTEKKHIITTLPLGIVHGDIHNLNIHFSKNGDFKLFDFDLMGEHYLAYDISTYIGFEIFLISLFKLEDKLPENYSSIIDGYSSIRAVTKDELELLPYLEMKRNIFLFGFYTEMIKQQGHKLTEGKTHEYWMVYNLKFFLYRCIDLKNKLESDEEFDYLSYVRIYKESDFLDYFSKLE